MNTPTDKSIHAPHDADSSTRIVYPWELPSIMRKHIVTGAMGTTYFFLLSGMYLVAFGNDLGMSYWHWGLLGATASFTHLLQLVSAHVVRRRSSRKNMWFVAAMLSRVCRGLAIVLAFAVLGWSAPAARAVFIGLLIVSSCCDAIAAPPWLSWLADLIPEDEHGHFMGRRSAWIAVANALVMLPIGLLVDRAGGTDNLLPALLAVFGTGFVIGILDLIIHRTIPEPMAERGKRRSLLASLRVPLHDARFRPWLVFNSIWTFGMTLGGSLATVYFVENLGIRRNFFGGSIVLLLLPMVGTALTGKRLGRLVDSHGVKPVLRGGHTLWALLPLFWLVATPQTAMVILGLGALVSGVGSGAALNAANKLLLRLPRSDEVAGYVALSTCIGALMGGLGAFVAGLLLEGLRGSTWTLAGRELVGFHVLFILSFLLRGSATLLIGRLPEPGREPQGVATP